LSDQMDGSIKILFVKRAQRLEQEATEYDDKLYWRRMVRRLECCSQKHASGWLAAQPGQRENFKEFNNAAFKVLYRLRLGLPVLSGSNEPCRCGEPHDVYGVHAITCMKTGIRAAHAKGLEMTFQQMASRALLPNGAKYKVGKNNKGEDLIVDFYTHRRDGRRCFYDSTMFSPLAAEHIMDESIAVSRKKEAKDKETKYKTACKDKTILGRTGHPFVPLVVDNFGGFTSTVEAWVKARAKTHGELNGLHPSQSIPQMFQILNFEIMQGVAAMVLHASEMDFSLQGQDARTA